MSYARTAITRFQGSFATKKATQLGSIAIKGALERTGLQDDTQNEIQISEALMGNVVSAGIGQSPCRQAGALYVVASYFPPSLFVFQMY